MSSKLFKMWLWSVAATVFAAQLALFASAGGAAIQDLVKIDAMPCSGDGLIAVDTISNREWLRLSRTQGLSYNQLTGPAYLCNPTCATGPFSGWTLASEQDVIELLRDAGMSPYGAENFDLVYVFLGLVDWTYSGSFGRYGSYGGGVGLTRDVAGTTVRAVEAALNTFSGTQSAWTQQDNFALGDNLSRGHGAWLYRPSPFTLPHAEFCASPTSGPAALIVNFTDKSIKATSWFWDFGDNSTSTEQNPVHIYSTPGSFTVSLTVTGTEGSDIATKTDLITLAVPSFADAASSAVWANMYFCSALANTWFASTTPGLYTYLSYYGRIGFHYAKEAYGRTRLALDENTTFWGKSALVYAEADLQIRLEALTYSDLVAGFAAAGEYEMAEYYAVYALSLAAAADLYNGYVIWCASMESSQPSSPCYRIQTSPSNYSGAAQHAVMANIYSDTAVDYGLYVLNDPAYYPIVSLYASKANDYAQATYNDLQHAPVPEGDNATSWAQYAKEYAAFEVAYRSDALSFFQLAMSAYQAGDLESAAANLINGYWRTAWADLYNGSVIWCASMANRGVTH